MAAGSSSSAPGYSGTPLPRKLGIKRDFTVALVAAPRDIARTLGTLPPGARLARGRPRTRQLTVWFVRSRQLLNRAERVAGEAGDAPLWVAWPKRSGPLASDFGDNEVRQAGLAAGLVDYKV